MKIYFQNVISDIDLIYITNLCKLDEWICYKKKFYKIISI